MAAQQPGAASRAVHTIVIHCSAHANGANARIDEIDAWHARRGFRRQEEWLPRMNPELRHVGYHFVIGVRGALMTGRHLDELGAHVKGCNTGTVGVCLIGTDAFTPAQWTVLRDNVSGLLQHYDIPPRFTNRYGKGGVCGHRDLSADLDKDGTVEPTEWVKSCPGFSVEAWLQGGMFPLKGHVIEPVPPPQREAIA